MIFSDRREMKEGELEMEEVERALKKLTNGKAARTDCMMGEFLKYGGETIRQVIYNICKESLEEGMVPQGWKKSVMLRYVY